MLTTKQVRKIIRDHDVDPRNIWTNRRAGPTGLERSVKCYIQDADDPTDLIHAVMSTGNAQFRVTHGRSRSSCNAPGFIVDCVLG